MARPPSAESILRNTKKAERNVETHADVASGMILPNNSGDHDGGIKKNAPINNYDLTNKEYVDTADNLKLDLDGSNANTTIDIQGENFTAGKGTFGGSSSAIIGDDVNSKAGAFTDAARTVELITTSIGLHVDEAGIGSKVANLVTNNEAGFFDDGLSNGLTLADGTNAINVNEDTLKIDYSGNLTTTGDIRTTQLTSTLSSSDVDGIIIDGDTNPFSTPNTKGTALKVIRTYDWGTNQIGTAEAISLRVTHESSGTTTEGLSKTWRPFFLEVINTGTINHNASSANSANLFPMQQVITDSGTYDTSSTGSYGINLIGTDVSITNTPTLSDTGNTNPSNEYVSRGMNIKINTNPVSIDGTWTIANYGVFIDITGTSEGSSTNRGIFVNKVTGADLNYSYYDISDATWWYRSDIGEMRIGESSTRFNMSSDGTNGIIDVSVALRIGNNVTNYTEISSTGDLTFVGSAGLPYGEIYAYDANNTITITGTGIANKVQITSFNTNGLSNNSTPDHTNDHITITKAGVYKVNVNIHAESTGGAAYEAGFAVYKNNGTGLFNNLHAHRNLSGGGGDTGSIGMSGLIDVAVNDTIEVWVWNETNTNNIIIDDITLNLIQIGGT